MNRKITFRVMAIFLFIFLFFYFGYLNRPNEQNDFWCIYTKVNDLSWQTYTAVNQINPSENLKVGDTYEVSLLENSTILYHWEVDTSNLAGLKLIEKKKVQPGKGIYSLLPVRDGENNDRVIFIFTVIDKVDEQLTFSYKPDVDAKVETYEKKEFIIHIVQSF